MNPARFCHVRYLGKRIASLKVAERAPANHEAVFFGATITPENLASGEETHHRIVGPDKTDVTSNWQRELAAGARDAEETVG